MFVTRLTVHAIVLCVKWSNWCNCSAGEVSTCFMYGSRPGFALPAGPVGQPICPSVYLSLHLSISPSLHLSLVSVSVHPSILYLSISLSACLSFCLAGLSIDALLPPHFFLFPSPPNPNTRPPRQNFSSQPTSAYMWHLHSHQQRHHLSTSKSKHVLL
jgi:hypothetical protein